jgi:hypothetical protein
VGKSELDGTINKTIIFSSLNGRYDEKILPSKAFDPSRTGDFKDLFLQKCQECSKSSNLSEALAVKETLLEQLVGVFDLPVLVRKLELPCLQSLIQMICKNISREIPPIPVLPTIYLFDRTETFVDSAWPLISLVHKLLYAMVLSTHIPRNTLSAAVTPLVISAIFRCFSTPDVRERQQIKLVLFGIAGRLQDRASFILSLISKAFRDASVGEPIRFGLPQIFELFTNLLQSIPALAKETFESVLFQELMPLHLSSEFQLYSGQLLSCMLFLLERNPRNSDQIVMYLLNHFPCASQKKQNLFIEELVALVQRLWESLSPRTARILFERITVLFSSSCAQISERAIVLVIADGFKQLLKQYFGTLGPLVVARALKVSRGHWNAESTFLAISLLQELSQLDPLNFAKMRRCSSPFNEARARRLEIWDSLQPGEVPAPPPPTEAQTPHQPKVGRPARSSIFPALSGGSKSKS